MAELSTVGTTLAQVRSLKVESALRVLVSPSAGLVVLVTGFVGLALYLGWHETLDDTAISLAYAKNLIHGHGLVLTEHADPVEGYSNFLWVLIMAPVIGLHIDGIAASKLIGLAFGTVALLLLALIPGAIAHRRTRWLDLLAPALTAMSLPFALWSISGLENGLESFLIVLVVYLSIREIDSDTARPWSSIGFLALALTRPDGIVFWVAAIGHRVLLSLLGRRQLRRDAIWLLACLIPLGVYHVWHYAYFGELVPNTYYAKASERNLGNLPDYLTANDPGVLYLRSFAEDYWIVMALAPFALAALAGARRFKYYSLPLLMLAAGGMAVLFSAGDWMLHYRFISPLLPLFFLCVVQGIEVGGEVAMRMLRSVPRQAFRAIGGAAALALVVVVGTVNLQWADDIHDRPYGASYDLILGIGRYIDDVAARVGVAKPLVALPDVGAVAYGTDVEIIDLAGLADAYIAKHPTGPQLADYLLVERKPDIIFSHGPWTRRANLEADSRLLQKYVIWSRRSVDGVVVNATYVLASHVLESSPCEGAISRSETIPLTSSTATVTGPVVAVEERRLGTTLQIGGAGRGSALVVVIPAEVSSRLPLPAPSLYFGKTLCVTGAVREFYGLQTIVVDSIDALALDIS